MRFTFASLASSSREIRFDLGRVGGYRNFCNKLWNAARFVLSQMQETAPAPSGDPPGGELSVADRWIRARFGRMVAEVQSAFADYRFDYAAQALYEFTWYEFCDWYIELAKPVLQAENASPGAKLGTRRTLLEILEALQRALHPLMPFVTEEIWQRVAPLAGKSGPTVMLAPYPQPADFPRDDQAEREIGWVQAVIRAVLQIRGEMNIPLSRRIPLLLHGASAQDKTHAEMFRPYLERLAALERITVLEPGASVPQSAAAMVGDLTLFVPMAGLIDVAAELERSSKVLAKANQDLTKMRARLSNESFVRNAPADVVAKDREREAELERTLTALSAQLERLRGLL
jgi:valyl-tRNA synthetase